MAPDILPIDLHPVRADELWTLEEAFLTSASRGILPVIAIDDIVVGDGYPGPVTAGLRRRFEERISAEAEVL